MISKVTTVSFAGIKVYPVTVEVQISAGMPAFTIVGLPDKAVGESKERIRSALVSLGISLPPKRITVNLAPADIIKEGSHFDLPIAVCLLASMNVVPQGVLHDYVIMGELGLDSSIAPVYGVLPAALFAKNNSLGFICPSKQGGEAAWSDNGDIIAPDNLLALIGHFKGTGHISAPQKTQAANDASQLDLKDIRGQETAKRALEIAAAGAHNLLMIGPPGTGKSMLAARLPGILPPLNSDEILEVSMIHSVAGMITDGKLVSSRPFRSPHHSASMPALIGGGIKAKPGEVSLAHKGVLFLDELPEFSRQTLEALRQPMEQGLVSIARVNTHITYPARFQLVAAMNPCRCGYLGVSGQECSKAPKCALEYQSKISGPLFDRIDMHIDVPSVPPWEISSPPPTESSAEVAKRVVAAVAIQEKRYQNTPFSRNSEVNGETLEQIINISSEANKILIDAATDFNLSARAYHRIIKIARTIADLECEAKITPAHMTEALSFRRIILRDY